MSSEPKLLTHEHAAVTIVEWKRQGKKVVFTNGCFDILHAGHIDYLEKAKGLGDALVVGVNSDASIQRLKGKKRPIVPVVDRCKVLCGLEAVDAVVIFEEDTPRQIIEKLLPDILIKGSDWPIDKIVGGKTVRAHGGEVRTVEFLEGHSTTSLVERIVERYCSREK